MYYPVTKPPDLNRSHAARAEKEGLNSYPKFTYVHMYYTALETARQPQLVPHKGERSASTSTEIIIGVGMDPKICL
jgi:hypothetical protein